MIYKIFSAAASTTHAINGRFNNERFSHLLVEFYFAADVTMATELAKLIITMSLAGPNVNRNIITRVPASDLVQYSNILSGVVGDAELSAATGQIARFLIPVGDLNLRNIDLVYDFQTSAAFAQTCTLYCSGIRLKDDEPILEYQRRNITTDGITVDSLLLAYDVSSAYNDSAVTTLTFPDGGQASILHSSAYHLLNSLANVENDIPWALLFSSKHMHSTGKQISVKLQPSAAFDCFFIQLSDIVL